MKTIKLILSQIFGRIYFQYFFEKINLISTTCMNYGNNSLSNDKSGESNVIQYVLNKLKISNKSVVNIMDVGANAGQYANYLNRGMKDISPFIHSFEPSPKTFELLKSSSANFPRITLNNFGLGAVNENLKLYLNFENSPGATIYKNALQLFELQNNIIQDIEIRRLDEYCIEKNIQYIDFLKIDVEGHELEVLKGAGDFLINKKIRFIQFEFSSYNIFSRTFFHDFWTLLSEDYNIYRVLNHGLYPIKSYSDKLEIFKMSNFFAELKS